LESLLGSIPGKVVDRLKKGTPLGAGAVHSLAPILFARPAAGHDHQEECKEERAESREQRAKSKRQKAKGKRQEARSKKQEARSKKNQIEET
jgi:hypothetical protein